MDSARSDIAARATRRRRAIAAATAAGSALLLAATPAATAGAGGEINGIFWLDDGGGDPTSPDFANGIFDASESGVGETYFEAILVRDGIPIFSTAPENSFLLPDLPLVPNPAAGEYTLPVPAGGTYRVKVDVNPEDGDPIGPDVEPNRYLVTSLDVGGDGTDNDIDPFTFTSAPVSVHGGAASVDVGLFTCPYGETIDDSLPLGVIERNVVHLAGHRLMQGADVVIQARSGFSTRYLVTPGTYRVTLVAADFTHGPGAQDQPNEQFAVRLFGHGDFDLDVEEIWTSPVIPDLPSDEVWHDAVVAEPVTFRNFVTAIELVHVEALVGRDLPTVNSIDPVCMVFDRLGEIEDI